MQSMMFKLLLKLLASKQHQTRIRMLKYRPPFLTVLRLPLYLVYLRRVGVRNPVFHDKVEQFCIISRHLTKQDVKCKLLQIVQKSIVHIYPEGYFQVTLIAKIETINNGTLIFIWSEMWKIMSFLRLHNYFSLSRSRNAQAIFTQKPPIKINRFQTQKHKVLIRTWSDKAFN